MPLSVVKMDRQMKEARIFNQITERKENVLGEPSDPSSESHLESTD